MIINLSMNKEERSWKTSNKIKQVKILTNYDPTLLPTHLPTTLPCFDSS